jgi:uncharacterized protein YkwD
MVTRKHIIMFVTVFGLLGVVLLVGVNAVPIPKPPTPDLHELYGIINQERASAGVQPVTENTALDASAAAHCADMVKQDYYSHVNPQGKQPNYWLTQQTVGTIPWKLMAENITYGYPTAQTVGQSFYNSPPHRENTLNGKFNQVGLALCSPKDYPDLVVEQFIQTP